MPITFTIEPNPAYPKNSYRDKLLTIRGLPQLMVTYYSSHDYKEPTSLNEALAIMYGRQQSVSTPKARKKPSQLPKRKRTKPLSLL